VDPLETVEPLRTRLAALEPGAPLVPWARRRARRLSDLRGVFADAAAHEQALRAGNPVVYETFEPPIPEAPGHLVCGVTVLHPGTVGAEFYMTRGHYHVHRQTAEVYHVLAGTGYLLLQREDGAAEAVPLAPGDLVYVPPGWGHRSVNTSSVPLLLLYVFPGDAGHDYEAVQAAGFRYTVVRTPTGPTLAERHALAPRSASGGRRDG
jgi:glucose-6-phosphate isomerase